MKSPLIYSSRLLYRLLMRGLYRHGGYAARYELVGRLVPAGARVVEVCCGDCYLYERHLRAKGARYVGLDISESFVRAAQRRGIDVRMFDLWQEELPRAQVVIMQASLYQFIQRAREILTRLLDAADERLIVAEPVRTLSASHNRLLSGVSRWLTQPANAPAGYTGDRFNEAELRSLFSQMPFLSETVLVPGGSELVGLFLKPTQRVQA